ncbi:hypothetical protein [Chitinophaga pinensis]|uniref:hypothetical protein n=1 Tax=Chitinophaga pinensis TaxID=79329 RepID=UPI0016514C84|nr:hypothetical protein [Chitinophaga pinensis]
MIIILSLFELSGSIALVLAAGISWLAMQYWLQGFAYRISTPRWAFLLAGVCNAARR